MAVRNLFRELPVRLAQAKKHRVSVAKMKSILISYALVRDIRFVMHFRGKKRLSWTIQSASDALAVITSIYGKEFMRKYFTSSWSGEGITIDSILPHVNEGAISHHTDVDANVADKQVQWHYIYIDNRPMSLSRNPAKHFLKMLRESYPNPQALQYSFVYLNFHCDVEKVKYDCNLDPAKSEVLFARFDVVCDYFTKFLQKVVGSRSARQPSPASDGFFDATGERIRLPSPPPSSQPDPDREIPSAGASLRNDVEIGGEIRQQPRMVNMRQTRLDEYRMPRNSDRLLAFSPSKNYIGNIDLTGTIRPPINTLTDFDGIDLTGGIISSRKQPIMTKQKTAMEETYDPPTISTYGIVGPDRIDDSSQPNLNRRPKSTRQYSPNAPKTSFPKTPRAKRTRKAPLTPSPKTPVPNLYSHTQIKVSPSPYDERPNSIDTTLNPWTIAAMTTRTPPSKRSRLQLPMQNQMPRPDRPKEDMHTDNFPSDNLQRLFVVRRVTMEEIVVGQVGLWSHVPPVCDLMDFLLRYCSSVDLCA